MNSLVLRPEEAASGVAVLEGARLRELSARHTFAPGASFSLGILCGGRGRAHVTAAGSGRVELRVTADAVALPREPLRLLVAAARPQTVKKVTSAAAQLGLLGVDFFGSVRGEKSYLTSKALSPEGLRAEATKGAEQACDSRLPIFTVSPTLRRGVGLRPSAPVRFFFDTDPSAPPFPGIVRPAGPGVVTAAFGPEAGWDQGERDYLLRLGFVPVSLGPRILRLETAVVAACGVLAGAVRGAPVAG